MPSHPPRAQAGAAEVKWARVEEILDPRSCILCSRVSLKLSKESTLQGDTQRKEQDLKVQHAEK